MANWKDSAHIQFEAWSKSYDRSILQQLFFRPTHEVLLRQLRLPPGGHVLDVGCGTGLLLRRLAALPEVGTVVGLDLSPSMLTTAEQNCAPAADKIQLVLGDSEHVPFPDSSFDVICCVHSFHHYPHQLAVLREFRRLLKPNGQLLLADGNRDTLWGWVLFDGIVTTIERHVHHCSQAKLRQLFAEANLGEVHFHYLGFWTPIFIAEARLSALPAVETPTSQSTQLFAA